MDNTIEITNLEVLNDRESFVNRINEIIKERKHNAKYMLSEEDIDYRLKEFLNLKGYEVSKYQEVRSKQVAKNIVDENGELNVLENETETVNVNVIEYIIDILDDTEDKFQEEFIKFLQDNNIE